MYENTAPRNVPGNRSEPFFVEKSEKKPNSSEPFWTVLNRFLGEGLRKPFWTVLWGVTFSPENRSEPFFVHPKVAFLSCCFELYVSIYFSFSDVRYLSAYGQLIEHIIIYQILSCQMNAIHILLYSYSYFVPFNIIWYSIFKPNIVFFTIIWAPLGTPLVLLLGPSCVGGSCGLVDSPRI